MKHVPGSTFAFLIETSDTSFLRVATSYIILPFVETLGFRFCMSAKVLTSSLVEMVLIVVPMKWQN